MDKGKIKLILIALAVLLVIFLLYKIGSKAADNKLDLENKRQNAAADLEIQKAADEYADEQYEKQMSALENKIELMTETQRADGINALDEYLGTLSTSQKDEYKFMRNKYISLMGKDPQLMPYDILKEWYEDYLVRVSLLNEYSDWGGDATKINIFDKEHDEVAEMNSLVNMQKAWALTAFDEAWRNAYTVFTGDADRKVFNEYDEGLLRKWLPYPNDLIGFKESLVHRYENFGIRAKDISAIFNQLWTFIDKEQFVQKSSAGNIKRWIDIDTGLYNEIMAMTPNELRLMSDLLIKAGGVKIVTDVKGRELKGKTKTPRTTWSGVMEWMGRLRADDDGKSQNSWATYLAKMPHMQAIKDRFDRYPGTNVSQLGFDSDADKVNFLINYSTNLIPLSESDVEAIKNGAKIEDLFEINFLNI